MSIRYWAFWPNRRSPTHSTSIMSHLSLQQTDDLCPDESISQVMIDDELGDIYSNSGCHTTREGACNSLPSLMTYFLVNSENIEEDRAFLKVQNSVMREY